MVQQASRNRGIDVLRALAVILVLFHHLDVCGEVPEGAFRPVIETLMRGGWVGVDCFFVLSGFLVSGLLFKEHQKHGRLKVGRFLIRRGLKIYPAFYVMLAVTMAVYVLGGRAFQWRDFLGELLFLQNYVGNLWRHTWSLAVEEHFYLSLVPILLVVFHLARDKGGAFVCRLIGAIYGILMVLCLCFRISRVAEMSDFDPQMHQFQTHLRFDALFLGVFLSAWSHYLPRSFSSLGKRASNRVLLVLLGLSFLVPAFIHEIADWPWLWSWGFLLFSWGAAMLLLGILPWQDGGGAVGRVLAKMGTYSYSIYLWHMMAGGWLATRIQQFAGGNWYVGALAYFVLSVGLGVLLSLAIEWPVLRLRDRWFPSKSQAV